MSLSNYSTYYAVAAYMEGKLIGIRIVETSIEARQVMAELMIEFPKAGIDIGYANFSHSRTIAFEAFGDDEGASLNVGLIG
jgi:hypothetical protein